jgi:ATP synthase protein I
MTPWPVVRAGVIVTGVLALPALGVAAAVSGGEGVVGAALGLCVVAAFFVISKVVVGAVAGRAPHLLLPAAMSTYVGKIILLGVLLVSVDDVDAVNSLAMAWSVVVGVFGWIGVELWFATHTRVPFYDPATFRERDRPAPERPGQ